MSRGEIGGDWIPMVRYRSKLDRRSKLDLLPTVYVRFMDCSRTIVMQQQSTMIALKNCNGYGILLYLSTACSMIPHLCKVLFARAIYATFIVVSSMDR